MKLNSLFLSLLALPLATAHADFTLIDNFEGLTPGELGSQNGWTSMAQYTLVNDPAGGSNQVLQFTLSGAAGTQGGAYKALGAAAVAEGSTATLFARFRFDATANANFGFSDVAAPAVYNDFESQINRQNGTPIKGRDGTVFQDLNPSGTVLLADNVDTWYHVWVIADNATDTSRVFLQSDGDPDYAAQTEVFPPDGTLNFRFGTSAALGTLMLRSQEGIAQWDDFYISAGTDLSNPIPGSASAFRITEFQYFEGSSIELTWTAVAGHRYAIDRSEDLSTWTALEDTITANATQASTELFGEDIASTSGDLFLRVRDLGLAP